MPLPTVPQDGLLKAAVFKDIGGAFENLLSPAPTNPLNQDG